ncbi:MAG: PEP/pyruvate-binding domain-containing protein [bacterium]
MERKNLSTENNYPEFDRKFLESTEEFTTIGKGGIGGKASGLAFIKKHISSNISSSNFPQINVHIPHLVVLKTSVFDAFMERNGLYDIALSNDSDVRIANAFMHADLPAEVLGDLRSIIQNLHTPLAVRSSSLLEDQKEEPFAGIYATKMIPNNQLNIDDRFRKLDEAIKFVYASVFFKAAKDYLKATHHSPSEEKMAVIIQEVIGERRYDRYYPTVSGVARSFNYYPIGKSKPGQGIINLALGLGKTIVDGGITWTYSPAFPKTPPPFASPNDMMKNTQNNFWAINMGKIEHYDPTKETEYLVESNLNDAEKDEALKNIASTFDPASNRISPGIGNNGPRIVNFAPLLQFNMFKFNEFIKHMLVVCEEAYSNPVETEFAFNFGKDNKRMDFGFLQVRPMMVLEEEVKIEPDELKAENNVAASEKVMGNGTIENIYDIVFVKPKSFEAKFTREIADEIEEINKDFLDNESKYLLIGFGRWGSSDPWLGIPVDWGQISCAKVIIESTLPGINVELSQGSHFFHNLTSFKVAYFSLHHEGKYKINWEWLENQPAQKELKFVKHIKLSNPLKIKIDGKTGSGVIKI